VNALGLLWKWRQRARIATQPHADVVAPAQHPLMGLLVLALVGEPQRLPVLVVITFRPEFAPPWSGHAHVIQLSLARLTQSLSNARLSLRLFTWPIRYPHRFWQTYQ
jgi:predicted ATPase